MAKIEYGPLVSRVTGKVGGMVFRGNGSKGVLSLKGHKGGQRSVRQIQNGQWVAEARASYEALSDEDRRSFDFSVSEGYLIRKDSGGKFPSGLAAYTAWYLTRRYGGGTLTPPLGSWNARTIQPGAYERWGLWTAGGATHFRLYTSGAGTAPMAIWVCRAQSMTRFPSRPLWRLIFCGGNGDVMSFVASPYPVPYQWAGVLDPFFAAAFGVAPVGSVWAMRYCEAGGGSIAYRGRPVLLEVTAAE